MDGGSELVQGKVGGGGEEVRARLGWMVVSELVLGKGGW